MVKFQFSKQKTKSAEKISQQVFYIMIGLAVLVFGLFFLVGYDLPFEENPDLMRLSLPYCAHPADVALPDRRYRSGSLFDDQRLSQQQVGGCSEWHSRASHLPHHMDRNFGSFAAYLLFGRFCSDAHQWRELCDWLWLKLSDMFVITSLLMLVAGIGAVCFGATRYIRKKN